jgi:hypothetical protein
MATVSVGLAMDTPSDNLTGPEPRFAFAMGAL